MRSRTHSPCCPTGSSELIVHRQRPFRRHTSQSGVAVQSERLLVGQMRAPVVLQADGDADVVGIRFRPHGAFALLECPQHPFADEIADVDALGLPWLAQAMRRAQEADSAPRPPSRRGSFGGWLYALAGSTRAWPPWST